MTRWWRATSVGVLLMEMSPWGRKFMECRRCAESHLVWWGRLCPGWGAVWATIWDQVTSSLTQQWRPLAADDMEKDEVWAPVQWMVVAISMVGLVSVPIPVVDGSVWASAMLSALCNSSRSSATRCTAIATLAEDEGRGGVDNSVH